MISGIIFLILIIIIAIILFLIFLPISYKFKIKYQENFYYHISLDNIIFQLNSRRSQNNTQTFISIFNFKKEIRKSKKEKKTEKTKTKPKKEEQKEKEKKKSKITKIKSKIHFLEKNLTRDIFFHMFNFIKKILNTLKPKNFKLNILIGLSDPYYNGLISAYYYTILGIFPHLSLNIAVNWEKEVVAGNGKISGKIIPGFLLYQILVFIFSRQTLKILWKVYKSKKGN